MDRLKFDLSRAQKSNSEHVDRFDRLGRQNELLEARSQELKKANLSDQSQIRDLRVKLRAAEHERTQLASKQGEAGEAKKALQAMDAKRREELREKDRKIAELEKSLSTEKRRKDTLEARLAETKATVQAEVEDVRIAKEATENDLRRAQDEKERAQAELEELRDRVEDTEGDLLQQLENHKLLLSRVAAEYGRLAASTVPKGTHQRVKREALSLQCRVLRLERKYANAEGQVVELAQLIRQTSDQNAVLKEHLRDAEENLTTIRLSQPQEEEVDTNTNDALQELLQQVQTDIHATEKETHEFLRADWDVWSDLARLRSDHLFFHSTSLLKHALDARRQIEAQSDKLLAAEGRQSELSVRLAAATAEHDSTRAQLIEASTSLLIAQASLESLKKDLDAEKKKTKTEVARLEQVVRREKEAYERTSSMLQQSRASEEALSNEIDQYVLQSHDEK